MREKTKSEATQTENETAKTEETASEPSSTETAYKAMDKISDDVTDITGNKKACRVQIPSIASTLRKKIFFPNLTKSKVIQPEDEIVDDSEIDPTKPPANKQKSDESTEAKANKIINQSEIKTEAGVAPLEKAVVEMLSKKAEEKEMIKNNQISESRHVGQKISSKPQ